MKKISRILLVIIIIFIPAKLTFAVTANISNLVFTTEQRSVAPGETSGSITVQTQNSSGTAEPVDETNDVVFTSSSPTGQFLNSSGNPVTTTMNKNTSSRTFFYTDDNAGTYTLTVMVTGRTTGTSFTASQSIQVGAEVVVDEDDVSNATTTSNTGNVATTSTITSVGGNTHLSAHSDDVDISNYKYKVEFGADAGRARVVTVNSPITFEARVGDFSSNLYARVSSDWSFGDGTMASGKTVTHSYAFPGEYNVILNVDIGGVKSVDRTVVKVIEPDLPIVSVSKGMGGYVEIRNDSNEEVNLQSFKVVSGSESFIFALDTIISPGAQIKFPFAFSIGAGDVMLMFPDGQVASASVKSIGDLIVDDGYEERRAQAVKRLVEFERSEEFFTHDPDVTERLLVEPETSLNQEVDDIVSSTSDPLVEAMQESKSEQEGFFGFVRNLFER